jgi:sialic acid synthase SpsE
MDWLRQFTDNVGFSDHTLGNEAAKLAISRGASIVEKHFTIDKNLPGKIQALCAEPSDLRELVEHAKKVEIMMGRGSHDMAEGEEDLRDVWINRWGCNR